MDVSRSHEVTWLPAADPPLRYFNTAHSLCLTVRGRTIQKATKWDDPTGLPFVQATQGATASFERSMAVAKGSLVLQDRAVRMEIPLQPAWGALQESQMENPPAAPVGWSALFGGAVPRVDPQEAFAAVLLYPEDDTEIGEIASQPFVADYIQDSFEQDPRLAAHLAKVTHVLIDNFDGAIKTCINLDRPRTYTVLYGHPAHAQKHAQNLWSELARSRRLDLAKNILFLPLARAQEAYRKSCDLLYAWIPYALYADTPKLQEATRTITGAIRQGGLAFIVGPATLRPLLQTQPGFQVISAEPVESLPTFQMHRTILPKARLKAGLTLFQMSHS
jgi:hypothetical protein